MTKLIPVRQMKLRTALNMSLYTKHSIFDVHYREC